MVGTLRFAHPTTTDPLEFDLPLSPNLRGSLFMAVAMAGFTMNDSITKLMSLEMNFGEVMLVRGLFAIVLIGALAFHQGAIRPLRTLFVKPVLPYTNIIGMVTWRKSTRTRWPSGFSAMGCGLSSSIR